MSEQEIYKDDISSYVSFLQGSDHYPEFDGGFVLSAAKCIKHAMKKKYHRGNTLYAVLDLLTRKIELEKTQELSRSLSWQLIQEFPLSILMELPGILQEKKIRVPIRLRNAIVYKFCNSTLNDMRRAFFFAPSKYREMFTYLYLPTDKLKNRSINHLSYMVAVKIFKEGTTDSIVKEVGVSDLVTKLRLPVHLIMQHINDEEDAELLSRLVSSEDFFRHAQWFRQIIGDMKFFPLAETLARRVKDPLSFLRIKEHLAEKGIMSPKLQELMEERTREVMDKLIKDANIKGLSILVDMSGSMEAAQELAIKLYRAFGFMGANITDLIAFNYSSQNVPLDQLEKLRPTGATSIGSGLVLLYQNLVSRQYENKPDAIILVTDMGENSSPTIPDAMRLFKEKNIDIPIIVLFIDGGMVGGYSESIVESAIRAKFEGHPTGYMKISDFHDRLTNEIIEEIVGLSGKVAVKEKEVTKVVGMRKPLHEVIGTVNVSNRESATLSPNFFKMLLTSTEHQV